MTSRASIWYPSQEGSHTADGDADPSVLSPPNHCLFTLVCFIVQERLAICGRHFDKTPSFSHGILFLFIYLFFNHFLSCHLPSYDSHLFLNTNAQVVLTEILPGAPPPLLASCTGFSLGESFHLVPLLTILTPQLSFHQQSLSQSLRTQSLSLQSFSIVCSC